MASFINSKGFQLFIHRAYGIGASLVIIGALFKLQHWTGAGIMLTIGMTTECIIFFISAFEAMQKSYKWERVYPELESDGAVASSAQAARPIVQPTQTVPAYTTAVPNYAASTNLDLGVDAIQMSNIKDGVNRLSDSMKNLTSLASVAEESQRLTTSLINANQAVNAVAQTSSTLSDAYKSTAQIVSSFSEQSKQGIDGIKGATNIYNEQLNSLSKNISAINSSFELQLKDTQKYQQSYGAFANEMTNLVSDVKKSVESSTALSNQMTALNNNISQLNSVYGNMLSAISSKLR